MSEGFRVIKTASNRFLLDFCGHRLTVTSKKKNKNGILVGDMVAVENGVIVDVFERKNSLLRPAVANVDRVIIVAAPMPKPDFFLIDKIVANCFHCGIEAVICLNKSDLMTDSFVKEFAVQYPFAETVAIRAIDGKIDGLAGLLCSGVNCLAGQSGVGKSTIINALLGIKRQTGDVSRVERGKNTTTDIELLSFGDGFIADTPGFGLLDFDGINHTELDLYYPEFEELLSRCRIHRCRHISEPDCAVRLAASEGIINPERYSRYLKLYAELKEKDKVFLKKSDNKK